MTSRVNPYVAAPALTKLLIDYGTQVGKAAAGLEPKLVELVKIRASQINGCAMCLRMHTREARRKGESEDRLYLLDAWRESPFYSERERAALAWTETLTRVAGTRAPDEDYRALAQHFTEEEQVKVTLLITAINSFNQLNVGFQLDPSLLDQLLAA